MDKIQSVATFDPSCMACFLDGTTYKINGKMFHYTDEVPENSIEKFNETVKSYRSNYRFALTYHEDYKYYFVSILGIKDEDMEFNDELNEEYNNLTNHLFENNITFN